MNTHDALYPPGVGIMKRVTSASPASPPTRRVRFDRPVLVSNVVSGALWLLIPIAVGAWPLSVVGAVYVVPASLFIAAVYAREALTMRQEVLTWIAPWLAAIALWATIVGAMGHFLFSLYVGLTFGTLGYLGWQILALAIRQFLVWRWKASSRLLIGVANTPPR